jgi:HK97 family phage prohead protease
MLYKASPMGELLDADNKSGIVKGYGSVFGNKDSDGDIITKGAYTKTIKENGERVRYLYQHNMDWPLGKMLNLYEDEKGLVFEAEIPQTRLGKDVMQLIKAGVVTENSVGILPINKAMVNGVREIREVKLFEISAVTLAANDQALILDVKGNVDVEKIANKYDNLAKLIRKGDISDELGYAIEAELYKLKSLFVNATEPSVEDTLPETKNEDVSEVLKYLYNSLKK